MNVSPNIRNHAQAAIVASKHTGLVLAGRILQMQGTYNVTSDMIDEAFSWDAGTTAALIEAVQKNTPVNFETLVAVTTLLGCPPFMNSPQTYMPVGMPGMGSHPWSSGSPPFLTTPSGAPFKGTRTGDGPNTTGPRTE